MSKLYVDTIYPNSGELVELSGNLHVSGTLNAYEFKTVVHDSTTYRGDTSFGNSVDDVSTFSSQVTASYGATIASGKKLKIGADQEYLKGDGTDIHFGLGSGGDINIPASIGLTFGDDGEKIEGDGTNLAIASSAELDLTAGSTVDINATTTVTVDGTGISIDGTDDSNFTVAGSNKDLTISVSGGSTQTLTVSSAGTGTNAIDINATAGGVDVDANGAISLDSAAGSIDINVVDGQTVNVGLNGAVETIWSPHGTAGSELWSTINTAGTTDGTDAAGAILLSAVAGGIGLAWADGKDLWAEGGRFVVTANEDAVDAIKLHADAGTSQTIQIVNDAGTTDGSDDAGAIELSAAAGGIGLAWADTKDLWAEGGQFVVTANHDTAGAIKLHADAGSSQTIQVVNDEGTGTAAIDIDATAGGIDIDAAGAISIDSSAGSIDINVVDGQTVNIGLNGAVEQIIAPHGTAGSELYSLINTAGTTDGTDAAGAILLSTVAGGIGLAWADTKDLWAEGGQFVVTANHDTAGAIKLHADAGTSQTILIQNDAGTGAGAVNIAADAGGIALDAGLDIVLDADGGDIFFKAGGATSGSLNFNTANKFTLSSSSPSNDFYLMSGRDMVLDADGGQVHIKDADASHFLLDCDNTKFVIYDDQDTGDLFSITVAQHGATTITTVDDDATAADLTFTIDGDIIFNPAGGDILPNADGTTNLGSSSKRWANVYTGDLHLKNNKGDWTILEEENYLCVVNNKTQKRYKMMLEEIGE